MNRAERLSILPKARGLGAQALGLVPSTSEHKGLASIIREQMYTPGRQIVIFRLHPCKATRAGYEIPLQKEFFVISPYDFEEAQLFSAEGQVRFIEGVVEEIRNGDKTIIMDAHD